MMDSFGRGDESYDDYNTAYSELLKTETRPVTPALAERHPLFLGEDDMPVDPYLSREWFDKEVEHVWKKKWQLACRLEEISKPGDYVVYDIVGMSLIVGRDADGELYAHHNFCLHRGRKLRTESGSATEFKCPFHEWTWNTNGSIKNIPCRSDFRELSDEEVHLRPARVGAWAGFVFVNFDMDAEPLEDFLGKLKDHFAPWGLENTCAVAQVRKRIGCNWKIGVEAFIEAYHTLGTHPQIAAYTGDTQTQVDVYADENFNRMITPYGVPSGLMEGPVSEQDILDASSIRPGGRVKQNAKALVPEGKTARQTIADNQRVQFGAMTGLDYSDVSDADMLDIIQYWVFPNFFPWGGMCSNLVYRFRPDGMRTDSAYLDVYILQRYNPENGAPKPAPLNILSDDEPWASAEELGGLGAIFDQDMANMAYVQEGAQISKATKGSTILTRYHEARIRDLYAKLHKAFAE